jgi:hypothetical protein
MPRAFWMSSMSSSAGVSLTVVMVAGYFSEPVAAADRRA